MPDLQGRVLQERDATHTVGTTIEAGLPNITGKLFVKKPDGNYPNFLIEGAFKELSKIWSSGNNGSIWHHILYEFNASYSSIIYGNSETVQPPAYAVRYLIRALP